LNPVSWRSWPDLADIVDCRFPQGQFPEGFDDKWFGPAPGLKPSHPKRGKLDISQLEIKRKLIAAITVAEALRK
jgi:hypothetical protein